MHRKTSSRSKDAGKPGNASDFNADNAALCLRLQRLRANNAALSPWSVFILNEKRGEGYFILRQRQHVQDKLDPESILRFMSYAEANELLDTAEVFVQ